MALDVAAAHGVGVTGPIQAGTKPFLTWASRNWPVWEGLVFPLRDPMGGLTGFQIRKLPSAVVPGRSSYVDYALATAHPRAFGLHEAMPYVWDSQRVVLVEGVFDYFGALAAGAPDTVANLTANVAGPMRRFLGRYARLVVAMLDTDAAGRTAAIRLQAMGQAEGFLVTAPVYQAKDFGTLLQAGRARELTPLLQRHYPTRSY